MTTMTRSITSNEANMLRNHQSDLKRRTRKCLERMSLPVGAWLGFMLAFAFRFGHDSAWKTGWFVGLALLPIAVLIGAAWHWSEFRKIKREIRCDKTLLARGQVLEERHVACRAAQVNFLIAGMAGIGPIERADYFYDLGDGTVLYLDAVWSHTDNDPPHPRRELTLVWSADHKDLLYVNTAGDRLEAVHAETQEPIALPDGTVLPGGLDAVLAAVGAKMKVQQTA